MSEGRRNPTPDEIAKLFANSTGAFGIIAVYGIVTNLLVSTMALRKLIHDDESGWFGLKFGQDEVRMFVATLVYTGIIFATSLVGGIVGGIVATGLPKLAILPALMTLIAIFFVSMRLSQYGVAAIATRNSVIKASWQITKGQVMRLFGAYVLWVIVGFIGSLIVQGISGYLAGMMGSSVDNELPTSLAVFLQVGWLFYVLMGGLAGGVAGLGLLCVGAYAWHQLNGNIPVSKPDF
jgi:hypothetical protein